jgi:hypothetical protein
MSRAFTTRELIDACRPDNDDPQRPELAAELAPLARELEQQPAIAAAYDRSQHFDRQVRSALDDVSLPAGLADRLLAGCEAAVVTPAVKDEPKSRTGFPRRKLMLAGFTSMASLLLIALGTYIVWPPNRGPVTGEALANSADQWFIQSGPDAKWQAVTNSTQTAFPIDRAVIIKPSRWAPLADPSVVAYELKVEGKRALLFVQRTNRPHAIRNFPSTELPATGGVYLAAWQRNGFVYVVLLPDRDIQIRQVIRSVPLT